MIKIQHFILLIVFVALALKVQADDDYLLSEKTYKALGKAQQLMEKEQYRQAGEKLAALLKQTRAGSYDHALVQQTLGFLYSAQKQYDKAAQAFQTALAADVLPEEISQTLRFNLAQLLMANRQYQKAIPMMERWLEQQDKVENQLYVLLANACFQNKNYQKVIKYIRIAINNDNSPTPREDWSRLLLAAQISLKQYPAAQKILENLITANPDKKVYWDQLSALYFQQNKQIVALAVKRLAQRLDLADGNTLIRLSELYRYLNIPYKAGQLLQQGIDNGIIAADLKNLNKLSQSWLDAREPAQAAKVMQSMLSRDNSGKTHLKLGQVYISMEQWQAAKRVLEGAVSRLKGDKLGQAYLLLGTVHFHLNQPQQAKSQFGKAAGYADQGKQARQWLHYIEYLLKEKDDEPVS